MSIRFNCAECGEPFDVPDAAAGMKGKCKCGAIMDVPSESTVEPEPAPEPEPEIEPESEATPESEAEPAVVPFKPSPDEDSGLEEDESVLADPPEIDEEESVDAVFLDLPEDEQSLFGVESGEEAVNDEAAPTEAAASAPEPTRNEPPPLPPDYATPPVIATVAPPSPAPPARSEPLERRYPQLRKYGRRLRLSAACIVGVATLYAAIFVWTWRIAFQLGDPIGIIAVILMAVGIVLMGVFASLGLRAFAEFLDVVMDIEENTRR